MIYSLLQFVTKRLALLEDTENQWFIVNVPYVFPMKWHFFWGLIAAYGTAGGLLLHFFLWFQHFQTPPGRDHPNRPPVPTSAAGSVRGVRSPASAVIPGTTSLGNTLIFHRNLQPAGGSFKDIRYLSLVLGSYTINMHLTTHRQKKQKVNICKCPLCIDSRLDLWPAKCTKLHHLFG